MFTKLMGEMWSLFDVLLALFPQGVTLYFSSDGLAIIC